MVWRLEHARSASTAAELVVRRGLGVLVCVAAGFAAGFAVVVAVAVSVAVSVSVAFAAVTALTGACALVSIGCVVSLGLWFGLTSNFGRQFGELVELFFGDDAEDDDVVFALFVALFGHVQGFWVDEAALDFCPTSIFGDVAGYVLLYHCQLLGPITSIRMVLRLSGVRHPP